MHVIAIVMNLWLQKDNWNNLLKFKFFLIPHYASSKYAWFHDQNKGIDLIRSACPAIHFSFNQTNLHLSNNKNSDKTNKYTKIKSAIDNHKKNFLQFRICFHDLSINEEMVVYFGIYSAKMFIKKKTRMIWAQTVAFIFFNWIFILISTIRRCYPKLTKRSIGIRTKDCYKFTLLYWKPFAAWSWLS